MSLVAVLKMLRARKNVNSSIPARQTLQKGLTIEAKFEGKWLLSRKGAKPSTLEIEIVARDALMVTGYSVRTGPAKDLSDPAIYSLLIPAQDDPDFASHRLCPACAARSLMKDDQGMYCPGCGHNLSNTKMLVPLEPEATVTSSFEALGLDARDEPEVVQPQKPRQSRVFFDSPRSKTSLGLDTKRQADSSFTRLENRTTLLDLLMDAASHLTQQGQEVRHHHLASLTDQEMMLEAQKLSGGVVWRSYLEMLALEHELEVLA